MFRLPCRQLEHGVYASSHWFDNVVEAGSIPASTSLTRPPRGELDKRKRVVDALQALYELDCFPVDLTAPKTSGSGEIQSPGGDIKMLWCGNSAMPHHSFSVFTSFLTKPFVRWKILLRCRGEFINIRDQSHGGSSATCLIDCVRRNMARSWLSEGLSPWRYVSVRHDSCQFEMKGLLTLTTP